MQIVSYRAIVVFLVWATNGYMLALGEKLMDIPNRYHPTYNEDRFRRTGECNTTETALSLGCKSIGATDIDSLPDAEGIIIPQSPIWTVSGSGAEPLHEITEPRVFSGLGPGAMPEDILAFEPYIILEVEAPVRKGRNKTILDHSTNATGSFYHQNSTIVVLCGLPPFLDCASKNVTTGTPLSECEDLGGTIVFIVVILSGGVVIVCGNSLVPLVLIFDKSYRNRHNYIKGSLAIVDMLVGWYLLCCIFPSTLWIRGETQGSVLNYVLESESSALSIGLGALLLLTTQASILHLLLLSAERFVAIKWPFLHHRLETRKIWIPLVAIWTFCTIEACLPAMLQEYFSYEFNSLLLVYFLNIKRMRGPDLHGILYAVITVVLPYILTILLIALTAGVAWKHLRASEDLAGSRRQPSTRTQTTYLRSTRGLKNESSRSMIPRTSNATTRRCLKPEVAVMKTTSLMIIAFSLSMIPIIVVFLLHVHGYHDCHSYALPYFTTFYIAIANSLSNVVIYSVRDMKFRKALKKIFGRKTKKSVGSSTHA